MLRLIERQPHLPPKAPCLFVICTLLPVRLGLEVDRIDYPDTALVMWDSRQHFEDMVRVTTAVNAAPSVIQ